jgi:hypothetical protein
MQVYVATLDTRHFSFEAYGESESQAQAALLAGLMRHRRMYPEAQVREMMQGAEVRLVLLNACYRDRALLKVPA